MFRCFRVVSRPDILIYAPGRTAASGRKQKFKHETLPIKRGFDGGIPITDGSVTLRFAVNGRVLTAHMGQCFGSRAQNKAAYAITQPGSPFNVRGFRNLGQVRELAVTNNIIQYVDGPGGPGRSVLVVGQSNPRGEHNPFMTLVAKVMMRCY